MTSSVFHFVRRRKFLIKKTVTDDKTSHIVCWAHSITIVGNKRGLSLLILSLAIAGDKGGLSLFINAEQYHYMRSYKKSAGLHVLISDHSDSKTLIEKKAVSASTGHHTTIAINVINVITFNPNFILFTRGCKAE